MPEWYFWQIIETSTSFMDTALLMRLFNLFFSASSVLTWILLVASYYTHSISCTLLQGLSSTAAASVASNMISSLYMSAA